MYSKIIVTKGGAGGNKIEDFVHKQENELAYQFPKAKPLESLTLSALGIVNLCLLRFHKPAVSKQTHTVGVWWGPNYPYF